MSIRNPVKGERVVFSKEKASLSPGPRAKDVKPAPKGDEYSYIVDKYWSLKDVYDDGSLLLVTRRGKEHLISADDPRLRRANFWERVFLKKRFPEVS